MSQLQNINTTDLKDAIRLGCRTMQNVFNARMDIRCALLPDEPSHGAISPLFWQHGEAADVLREELQRMRSVGIGQCILEARPHPDWMGPGWWDSLDVIFAEAERLGMQVWIFDDATYPSGLAGKRILERHPQHVKAYLAERVVDARGPQPNASVRIGAWVGGDERLVAVVAARRHDPTESGLVGDSLLDVTEQTRDGVLRWAIPDGWWRISILVRTRHGGEEWTKDHLNPLVPEAVQAYLTEVHEQHYARYGQRYRRTFAGFFTDEPRFGNAGTYDAILGQYGMVLPWCDDLLPELDGVWRAPFRRVLPALWNDAGELSNRARFAYMNAVSQRFGRNFTGQIGDWCRARGLRLIGHVVEDNNAHARLGYGAGHFFRALQGQDMSGLDYVYQVWPGWSEGRMLTPFGNLDLSFFYWGLAKLASSGAHLDPRKHGQTMCEIFGAYGWRLGLRNMKWLTDHACVRGINFIVPHAFSPKAFPDPDCPPHFYARGENPQWHLFGLWSQYAERVCQLLTNAEHVAPVAVAYHAEAEWAGRCEHFQHAVRALAEHQIDCDVAPWDYLLDEQRTRAGQGTFTIHRETFRCLIVPWAERLPAAAVTFCLRAADAGVRVIFTQALPIGLSDTATSPDLLAALRGHAGVAVWPTTALADAVPAAWMGVRLDTSIPHLRLTHYRRGKLDFWFCVNEHTTQTVDTQLRFGKVRPPVIYDALRDTVSAADCRCQGEETAVRLHLEPYSSCFVVFAEEQALPAPVPRQPYLSELRTAQQVEGPWAIATTHATEYPRFTGATNASTLGDVSQPDRLPKFGGVLAYETDVHCPADSAQGTWMDLGEVYETSEVWWDGQRVGASICPPHRYALGRTSKGTHKLRIEVATTLARSHGDNVFDRAVPLDPVGLLGPVRLMSREGV